MLALLVCSYRLGLSDSEAQPTPSNYFAETHSTNLSYCSLKPLSVLTTGG
jgi:hypothetical protein